VYIIKVAGEGQERKGDRGAVWSTGKTVKLIPRGFVIKTKKPQTGTDAGKGEG